MKITNTPVSGALRRSLVPVLLVAMSLVGTSANAAKFGVRVVDDLGQPIPGAAVCIGLQGNYSQFGAMFTDANGGAIVDVPNIPLIVTVSKTRFAGLRTAEPAREYSLIKQVKLLEGVPGPRCRAGSALVNVDTSGKSALQVASIDIEQGVYSKTLRPEVIGAPSHYRISADREFAGAKWLRFDSTIPLVGSLLDEESVYVQLRRFKGNSKSWLEARSEVITVRLVN